MVDQSVLVSPTTAGWAVLAVDADGSLISANPLARQILGLPAETATVGYKLERTLGSMSATASAPMSVGHPLEMMILSDPLGNQVALQATCLDLDPSLAGQPLTLVLLDQRYSAPAAVVSLTADALSHMSQEARAPLCVILGYLDWLQQQTRTVRRDKLTKVIGVLRHHARVLEQLVDNFLGAISLLSGRFAVEPKPVRIAALLDDAAALVHLLNADRRHVLAFVLPAPEATVWADRQHVVQAIANLLTSATKHAPDGDRITLTVSRANDDWRFAVSQHSGGLPWWSGQEGLADSTSLGTTDFGLALTKAVIELHGGQIGLSSSTESASTLWFTLRAAGST